MYLYHGSNVVVSKPEIKDISRGLDFGKGFYTTSDYKQAFSFSKRKTLTLGQGKPIVSIYSFDIDSAKECCNIKQFESPSEEWLDFVTEHRNNAYLSDEYDIIFGPVADDNVYRVVSLYFNNVLTKDEAIKRLLPMKLKDQYVFCTDKSLSFLKFKEGREGEDDNA